MYDSSTTDLRFVSYHRSMYIVHRVCPVMFPVECSTGNTPVVRGNGCMCSVAWCSVLHWTVVCSLWNVPLWTRQWYVGMAACACAPLNSSVFPVKSSTLCTTLKMLITLDGPYLLSNQFYVKPNPNHTRRYMNLGHDWSLVPHLYQCFHNSNHVNITNISPC